MEPTIQMSRPAEQTGTTWAEQLTPDVSSAIATISLYGPQAETIVANSFQAKSGRNRTLEIGQSTFGYWSVYNSNSRPEDSPKEHVVLYRPADDRFEIHCHGGRSVCRLLLNQLKSLGCDLSAGAQWPTRHIGRIESQSESALIHASTLKVAEILLDQLEGSLRRALEELVTAIASGNLTQAMRFCRQLLDRAPLGEKLVRPWTLTLAGPPNVGKSSLTNAIFGSNRMLVHRDPGTTRDAVDTTVVISSWPVTITDTAGIRDTEETIELQGIVVAQRKWQESDIGLLVVDATIGWTPIHDQLADLRRDPILVVQNKCDLNPLAALPNDILKRATGLITRSSESRHSVNTNATQRAGIAELLQILSEHLDSHLPPVGTAVPFTREQVLILHDCFDHLIAGQTSLAEIAIRQCLSAK